MGKMAEKLGWVSGVRNREMSRERKKTFIKSAVKYVRVRTIRGLIRGRRSAS